MAEPALSPNADPRRITPREQLRGVIGQPLTGLGENDHLDSFARHSLARWPFRVLSTANAAGQRDASPKGDTARVEAVDDAVANDCREYA